MLVLSHPFVVFSSFSLSARTQMCVCDNFLITSKIDVNHSFTDWVLPVAAGLGGVLFLTIVIIAVVMYCRRRQRPSPISDEVRSRNEV